MKSLHFFLLLISLQVYGQDDCSFNQSTQTDEFIKEIIEFQNYTWDDSLKTATIILNNGDTLFAFRGGCHHFGISGTLIQLNKKQLEIDQKYVYEKGLWIAERLFVKSDFEELKVLILDKKYSVEVYDDYGFFIRFDHDFFSEYYLLAIWNKKSIRIDIGYYYS